ncbi:hypothetical protein ACFQZZ_33330 [Nocardia sp. GCM10030253]|uniref:hypothetical protein n=1 Tax=Nocardia sp. GCM10030253 TaxID=3273404 RepID=UPI003645844A
MMTSGSGRAAALGAVALVAATCAGCGTPDTAPTITTQVPNPSPASCESSTVVTQDSSVELAADFDTAPDRLVIRYRVTNHRRDPLFLADRVRTSRLPPEQAYNLVPRSDQVVEISRRFYPIGQCPIAASRPPDPPEMVRVDPGATYGSEFTVAVPFEVEHPMTSEAARFLAPMPPRPYPVVFCVGAVPTQRPNPSPDRGDTTHPLYSPHGFQFEAQTTFCTPVHMV